MRLLLFFILGCILHSCSSSPHKERSSTFEMEIKYIYKGDSILQDSILFDRSLYSDETDPYGVYNRQEGIVSDAETAVRICEAVLFPIYGQNIILSQIPYEVTKINDRYWHISGTLKKNNRIEGGVFHLVLDKKDGKICAIWHEK